MKSQESNLNENESFLWFQRSDTKKSTKIIPIDKKRGSQMFNSPIMLTNQDTVNDAGQDTETNNFKNVNLRKKSE